MKYDALSNQIKLWIDQMHHVASDLPETGACAIASALDLWQWTADFLLGTKGSKDSPCGPDTQCGPAEWQAMADALGGLLSAGAMVQATCEQLRSDDEEKPEAPEGLDALQLNLCQGQACRAAAQAGQTCAELVFGTRHHPKWDVSCEECMDAGEVDSLDAVMHGFSYGARTSGDVLESDGSHPEKAGPCVQLGKLAGFLSRRKKLDGCLSGSWLARQRAVQSLQELA